MQIRVEEYIRPDGSIPYKDWFDSLDPQAAAKVTTAKLRMELGNTSNVKWFSGIGEYVIDWGTGYRIHLARDGESLIVLFGGGTKRRQQADIDRAQALTPSTGHEKRLRRSTTRPRSERGDDHGAYS
ncbi:MAG: type II toxin-antitoxin system RelE/ParE family toxin [Steroidobacteraceae bacterium]|jgi:putative addiction module killer protein